MYDAIDCQGFAGGFTLGTVQAGFRLVGKREHPGGFGVPAVEANRHLLGNDWQAQATHADEWEPYLVPYVFGNPPCSGFSLLSRSDFRGPDSPINSCMWDFVGFAARCHAQVAVFESVATAYKGGRDLFRALREDLEARTGDRWHLTHVLHNAYSLGGAAIRKRYFFVAHRIPFGVERVELQAVPTFWDVIGDLRDMPHQWEAQPYLHEPTWWSQPLRSATGMVDGHQFKDTPLLERGLDIMERVGWGFRENMASALARYWNETGTLPESFKGLATYQKLIESAPDFKMGFNQMIRWYPDRAARVITGAALITVLHPYENRTITHREALRVMGFPDDWRIDSIAGHSGLASFWGKGIPVNCGRWISNWVRESLDGNPGSVTGEEVGERESLIDVTYDYSHLSREK